MPSPISRNELIETIKVIEKYLEDSKWIAGDNLTIADFSVVANISTIVECGYDLSQHSNLSRWYKQCQSFKGFEENQGGAAWLANLVTEKLKCSLY